MKHIYLDYAAATPLDEDVLAAMRPYFSREFHNPSAIYMAAKKVSADIDEARSKVAAIMGARPAEVVFTAGGTEANNMAVIGVAQAYPGAHMVTTTLEHESVRAPLEFMATRGGSWSEAMPRPDGITDPAAVIRAVNDQTVLVSVMYANNEIGTIQPIKQIGKELGRIRQARLAKGNNLPLYFHTDACQAANYLDLHVHRLGVDLMTLNGGKIYGPKQSGVLFVASHVKLTPLIHGGGQERNMRSGTENVPAIIGFAQALQAAQSKARDETARIAGLRDEFLGLLGQKIPTITINGSLKQRLPNNVHVTIPGADNERLLFGLDEKGVQCATGSACSASKAETSHVLKAIGLADSEARASLRFTLGRQTTRTDIRSAVAALANLVA